LSAVTAVNADEPAHMLASLPVRLELGALANAAIEGMSPVRMSLVGAWAAMVLAALAVAALLQGVLSLSERRGAFVSAVTHELRTPLTTFRMYAEMLADNMVPNATSRRHYLETLRVEADRLTHLVENVLLYARLERGRPGGRVAPVAVSRILEQATGRLTDRARQAHLEIVVEASEAVRESRVLADPAAVEQILFNLVDNACKYAAGATDRTLHLEARRNAHHVELLLRDHGPGIAAEQRRVLFQPFRKSAHDAARSAPGVGLGLALCRRLARDMGGELSYAPDPSGGACFTLRLRAVAEFEGSTIPSARHVRFVASVKKSGRSFGRSTFVSDSYLGGGGMPCPYRKPHPRELAALLAGD
jgi:signal transduction histidine kinase